MDAAQKSLIEPYSQGDLLDRAEKFGGPTTSFLSIPSFDSSKVKKKKKK